MEMCQCHSCGGTMNWYAHSFDYHLPAGIIVVEQTGFHCDQCGRAEVRYENSKMYNFIPSDYQYSYQKHI